MGKINDFFRSDTNRIKTEVNLTSQFLIQDTSDWLSSLGVPFTIYDDWEILKLKYQKINPIAHVIGEGAEIPSFQTGSWSTERIYTAKLGAQIDYFEKHMKEMIQWERQVTGVSEAVKNAIFGQVSDVVERVVKLHKRLTTEVLYSGACTFTDATTGLGVNLTYTSDANYYPADLAGGATWSTPASATPLANLRAHTEAYRSVGFPVATVMNSNTYSAMLATTEVRESVLGMKFGEIAGASNYPISDDDVNSVLAIPQRGIRIPPIRLVDAQYQTLSADGTVGASEYYVPDGYYFFVWPNNAEAALAPTVEGDGAGGIFSASEEVSRQPAHDRLYAVANGIPFVKDERKMGGRKVY